MPDLDVDVVGDDGSWYGPITLEGVESGDGRMFNAGSLTWADLPIPLMYAEQNLGEHKGSTRVGSIETIERRGNQLFGTGKYSIKDPVGRKAHSRHKEYGKYGVSVDVDSVKDAHVEFVFADGAESDPFAKPELTVFHSGRIRGATLVDFPAFNEAQLALGQEPVNPEAEAVVASAALDNPWNGALTLGLVAAGDAGVINRSYAVQLFGYVPDGDRVVLGDCRFLHHEVDDMGVAGAANLVACGAGINALNVRPGKLTRAQRQSAYDHLSGHIAAAGQQPPLLELETQMDELTASAVLTLESAPPKEFFTDPALDGPTALSVTADGRVFGHAALWETCHTSYGDRCVTAPSETSHDYFRLGEVITADGSRVPVGTITLGTGHAPQSGISARGAIEHYDHTGTAVADVATGNDRWGIWVSGAVRPNVSETRLRELMAAKISGDWRRIAGDFRLVGLLAVNVPGFPVPRRTAGVDAGVQLSLTAAGVYDEAIVLQQERAALMAEMKTMIAETVGRDAASLKAALVASLSE